MSQSPEKVSATRTPVRVKICGITRPEDALAAVRAGADALGMVFYPASPRCNTVAGARAIACVVPPFISRVGLFVNPSVAEVETVLAAVPLELLQFHGDEPPEFCARFHRPWVKAARVRPGFDLVEYAARYQAAGASGLVLDAYTQDYGGAGVCFDWTLIPRDLPLPIILAGGLNVDNVSEAIAALAPWAVDVSSGVEAPLAPKGIKDAALIARFITQAKEAKAGAS